MVRKSRAMTVRIRLCAPNDVHVWIRLSVELASVSAVPCADGIPGPVPDIAGPFPVKDPAVADEALVFQLYRLCRVVEGDLTELVGGERGGGREDGCGQGVDEVEASAVADELDRVQWRRVWLVNLWAREEVPHCVARVEVNDGCGGRGGAAAAAAAAGPCGSRSLWHWPLAASQSEQSVCRMMRHARFLVTV
jgi:hypothetical protein